MDSKQNWLERPIHPAFPKLTYEILIFAAVILLAIVTRFYKLEPRVMSHDESLHTYFSWLLYRGQGYEHSPMMHGPFQFHIVALTYFLFGVSDFTSRIPAVMFSIATVWMVWYWRRYLGKWGALIAGFLLVISPYMLYYGRYVRNESFVGFSGVLMLYAMLRHLEVGGKKYLLMLAAALALHYTTKETAFIYTAQALLFLAIYFIAQVTRRSWKDAEKDYRSFIIALGIAVLFAGLAVGYGLYMRDTPTITGAETAMPSNPESPLAQNMANSISPTMIVLVVAALTALVFAAVSLIRGYTWERIRNERSFDLLMVCGTIVLPMLSPLPVSLLKGWLNVAIPTTAPEVINMSKDIRSILVIVGFLVLMFVLSAVAGWLWNKEKWWQTSLVFWVPFTILYTTVFTKGSGFFTGTIGSLGYWIVQQEVERGSQPWYFYALIQIPVYEFLPALGLILAIIVGLRRKPASKSRENDETPELLNESDITESEERNFPNTFSLLVWWSVTSVIAFTYAGERMPWLTYHMAWPMILITGWALGRIIDTTDFAKLKEQRVPLTLATLSIFVVSVMGTILALNGPIPPFQGKELAQLQATSTFLLPLAATILSAVGAVYLFRGWTFQQVRHMFVLVFFALIAVLTGRAAFRASYITYDQATEFLVYAHGATGIKEVMAQAAEISERTTGGLGVPLAYDASAPDTGVSWPFVWYLRDYTQQTAFDQPTRSLRESMVVIVDEKNFDKIEPALGPGYYRMDYIRMWWPMQDYFTLSYDRDPTQPFPPDYACKGIVGFMKLFKSRDYTPFCEAFTNPAVRRGIIQIWLNRDYTRYAEAKGRSDLTLTTWNPADKMRLYIRQDVATKIWNYGVAPTVLETAEDPTEKKYSPLAADFILDVSMENPLRLNAPRSLAFADDGTLYVADSRNHRVLHMDTQGNVLHEWGTYADGVGTPIGDGTFNEPWGVAVAPDGSVYVTDTWNHRIEKFTTEGKFITAWGIFGQGETPASFYGPRGLAVDSEGRVYVTDTGNKRVAVFDPNGNFITDFGSAGFDPGQFDEPVGIAVDREGTVYVADTWNKRIQTFVPVESEGQLTYVPKKQWDVYGWFGQSLDNKPFIAVNNALHVFITDPDGYRIMEFDQNGELVRVWDDIETENSLGIPSGIAIDGEGHVWITDSSNNRLRRYTLP
ncbi:Serine/threonine-protein kinase PknD [Anaerolineales bacterium]|nr:Serine/threonine-protein kinase PknD [Anaerolineales bacterium]